MIERSLFVFGSPTISQKRPLPGVRERERERRERKEKRERERERESAAREMQVKAVVGERRKP